jgi:endonuclease/exonuclease/phosphatase family metal-dependent hydrolase
MSTLRLLSYNVRSLRDDASAVARVIRAAEPDLVCIQEAPRLFRWRSPCYRGLVPAQMVNAMMTRSMKSE